MARGPEIAALLVVLACGEPPPPVAFADYGLAGQDALCDWAVRCRHVPDDAICRRMLDPKSFDTRRAADAIAAGRLRYDPEAAGRCLAAGRAAVCSAPAFEDPSCAQVFVGLVAEGGGCAGDRDCAGRAPCLVASCAAGCCTGTCEAPPAPVAPPQLAPVGGACQGHDDCVATAFCAEDRRCRALPTRPGEHCLFGCATGDLYCDVFSETCRVHAALGEACSGEKKCNPNYAFCDGVCRLRPGAGEVCDDLDRRCIPSTTCDADAGACAARGGSGAGCAVDRQCEFACDAEAGACVGYRSCQPS